jgi:formylmethanofuran dehydrogenase subunit A
VQAGLSDQAGMLQVSLHPATIAHSVVEQVRRQLLVAAAQLGQQPAIPAAAAQESCLDEIVAQDLAVKRRPAGQDRQAAALGEGADAQDGVVAEIVGFARLPEAVAHRQHHPGEARRELQHGTPS